MSEEPLEAQEPAKTPSRKGPKIAGLLILLAMAVYGVQRYVYGLSYQDTDDAFLEGRIVSVGSRAPGHVLSVAVRDNQEVKAGDLLLEIDPRDYVLRLERARAALEVARARALAADKSVEFSKVSGEAGITGAQSGIDRAKASVETLFMGVEAARSRARQAASQAEAAALQEKRAQAEVAAAQAQADQAESDRVRMALLVEKDAATVQNREQAETAAKSAQANLAAVKARAEATVAEVAAARSAAESATNAQYQAEAAVREARTGVNQAIARYTEARGSVYQVAANQSQAAALAADVQAAEAAVRQAELELSYTKVYAPEGGLVTKKSVEPGMYVQVGQPLLALVAKDLWVVANFKESQLVKMRPGQTATVKVDAFPDREFKAHVDSIQAGTGARFSLLPPENATGNYIKVVQRLPVKLVFDEPLPAELHLGPGMSVEPVVRIK